MGRIRYTLRQMPSVRPVAGLVALAATLVPSIAAEAAAPRPDVPRTHVAAAPAVPRAAGLLADRLGANGIVDIDPVTGTPRNLGSLDGFLTEPSSRDPHDIVISYVRHHADVFRLTGAEIGDLQQVRRYTDVEGITHLMWRQWHGSLPVVGADLRAAVSSDGRIITIQGAPVADFGRPIARPAIHSARAVQAAGAGIRVTHARTALALAPVRGGVRLVYRIAGQAGASEFFNATVDAASGRVLERHNMVKAAQAGSVWNYYPSSQPAPPGDPLAFTRHNVDFGPGGMGWLKSGDTMLDGDNAHVYTDTSDDDFEDNGDKIPADTSASMFNTFGGTNCSGTYPCSWTKNTTNWQMNRNQNGGQVFYFINTFHDWLAQPPIGFTPAAGNFEGSDFVEGQIMNGAATKAPGIPDANHVDNSDFIAMPDGTASIMELDLFEPITGFQDALAANGGDEADVVYHEYTHGLSGRTITTVDGFEAVDGIQAGALGEAWSDWYAMDYLVHSGTQTDGPSPDVKVGIYLTGGDGIRSEPMDCPVAPVSGCPGVLTAGAGGYTYGDLGQIDPSGVEVHADGEIWAQTLWQLRGRIGEDHARQLITEGMRLTPAYPSFLDARNAIIEATHTLQPGDLAAIWQVFTSRGMGYFASTAGDDDASPIQSFSAAPTAGSPRVTVAGRVVDSLSGAPVGGVAVDFGGHETPGATQTLLVGRTAATGNYLLRGVPVHTYPQLFFDKFGYFGDRKLNVKVAANPTRLTPARLLRDWAMFQPLGFLGSDLTGAGCGPFNAIDGDFGFGWAARPQAGHLPTVKVRLAGTADLYRIGISPWVACPLFSDAASVGRLKMETSRDGRHWQSLGDKRFTASELDFEVPFKVPAFARYRVRYVRITLERNMGDPSGYIGLGELTVYALPAFSVKASLHKTHGGRAKLVLTCNQPCSTRVGRTRVSMGAAGTVRKTVRARGRVRLTFTATKTDRRISKTVRVK
jgi:extracellular elastinolytic metalloproteinase